MSASRSQAATSTRLDSPSIISDISVMTDIVENIQIGADCNPEEIESFTCLFKELCDVFAWSYEEMPGIDLSIFEHEIKLYDNAKPIHQRL